MTGDVVLVLEEGMEVVETTGTIRGGDDRQVTMPEIDTPRHRLTSHSNSEETILIYRGDSRDKCLTCRFWLWIRLMSKFLRLL